jgi:MFS family permease
MTAAEAVAGIDRARPTIPVKPSFIAAFTLAQIGAYVSFMPLFQVLMPLKAEAIDSANKAVVLSQVAILGAITASLANLLAGAISDRTTSRFGRRSPWMVVGALSTVASYFLIMMAQNVVQLMVAIVCFQVAFNLLFSALLAVLPDRVPDAQKGRVAAFLSLGHPIGAMAGVVLVGGLLVNEASRYVAIGVVLLAAIAPFALGLNDRRCRPASGRRSAGALPGRVLDQSARPPRLRPGLGQPVHGADRDHPDPVLHAVLPAGRAALFRPVSGPARRAGHGPADHRGHLSPTSPAACWAGCCPTASSAASCSRPARP